MRLEEYQPILGRLHWHLAANRISRGESRDWLFVLLHLYGPCTRRELQAVGRGLVGKTGMYRNLSVFLQFGVAQEVRPGLYELTDRFKQHHHYQLCRVCGLRSGFWDEGLERALEKTAEKAGFVLEEH